MKKWVALIALALLMFVNAVSAQSLEVSTFDVANNLYSRGSYDEAAKLYEQLIAQGVVDSELYYNLGTTYLRQEDFGRAVLNLRRAAELSPRDGDIRENLLYAREQVAVDLPELLDTIDGSAGWFTVNEALTVALLLWLLLLGLVFVYRNPRSERQRTAAQSGALVTLGVLLLVGVLLGGKLFAQRNQPSAVVVADSAEIYLLPNTTQDPTATLNGGAELLLLEQNGAWANVQLDGGELEGWISAEQIETVLP